jgi:hypothetical protein
MKFQTKNLTNTVLCGCCVHGIMVGNGAEDIEFCQDWQKPNTAPDFLCSKTSLNQKYKNLIIGGTTN